MSKKINIWVLIAGAVVGIAAVALTALGNPANMGFCIACFLRDIAGATKLHSAAVVQYIRPEIIGLVLGSTIIALATGEFKPRAGSSPAVRFILGAIVMIGALVFLGCPLRMVIRMGGGDLNALPGGVPFHRRHKNGTDARVNQFLDLLVLPLLIHGRIPGEQDVALQLQMAPDLGVQHLEVGIVHGHIGRAKYTLLPRLPGRQVSRTPVEQIDRGQQRYHTDRNGGNGGKPFA